jgi:hypothetical protein
MGICQDASDVVCRTLPLVCLLDWSDLVSGQVPLMCKSEVGPIPLADERSDRSTDGAAASIHIAERDGTSVEGGRTRGTQDTQDNHRRIEKLEVF